MDARYIKIEQMGDYDGQVVELRGWLYNSRAGGKVQFLILRDGSGLCQGIYEKTEANVELFKQVKHLGQESSIIVRGTVRKEERSVGGYELGITEVEVMHETHDYPITPKSHGIDFLLKNRHLHLGFQE